MRGRPAAPAELVAGCQNPDMIGRLHGIVLDCADPDSLARFYEELLGMQRVQDEGDWVVIGDAAGRLQDMRDRYAPYIARVRAREAG